MVIQENNLEVSRGKCSEPGTAEGSEGPISPPAGILGGRVPLRTFLAFRGLWICLISIQIWWIFYSRRTCKKNMCFLYITDFFFFLIRVMFIHLYSIFLLHSGTLKMLQICLYRIFQTEINIE